MKSFETDSRLSNGCTAGLALMSFPGIISEVFAARADKTRDEIMKEVREKAEWRLPGAANAWRL